MRPSTDEASLNRAHDPTTNDQEVDAWRTEVDSALRADIRRLGNPLGGTLVRHGDPELFEVFEEIRELSRVSDAGDEEALARSSPFRRCGG